MMSSEPEKTTIELITLREACARIGVHVSTYYRHPEILPPPISLIGEKGGRRTLRFVASEIDEKLREMVKQRDARDGAA